MPSSKRNKTVSLTKVKKNGRAGKEALVTVIMECLEKYTHIYVLKMENMRSNGLKDLRIQFKEDRFVFGKQNVMSLALGRTPEEEPAENLSLVSAQLSGTSALLFTNRPQKEVVAFYEKFQEDEFARSGAPAVRDIVLQQGPLQFQHTMVDPLRKLGLPVMLKNGTVMCEREHKVCSKGELLTPEMAQILKLTGTKMGQFKPELKCVWSNGSFSEL